MLDLNVLKADIDNFINELPLLNERINELEYEAGCVGFWDDIEFAQRETKLLMQLQSKRSKLIRMRDSYNELEILREWVVMGEMTRTEYDAQVDDIAQMVEEYKRNTLLSGKYDSENAILTFHAGSGGDEACDYTDMILRMVVRWAESSGFTAKLTDMESGDIAGVKSATIELKGENAYGYAKALNGVFRLVRISPFDAAGRRHTSFMAIEVIPELANAPDIIINPDDIILETMTAHVKAGGQSMQHNNTGVRITHKPSGIVIRYDVERSQLQNRNAAMEMLKARLAILEEQKREDELNSIKGEKTENGWGNAICSIVLMPYQLVKDNRTGWETTQTDKFLDGDLDDFIRAYLKWYNTKEKEND